MSQITAPFPLGKTFYGESGTIDVSSSYANVDGIHLEGRECLVPDYVTSDPTNTRGSDLVKTRIVRNVSGSTLYGGFAAVYSTSARLRRINGYARLTGTDVAGIIDPNLGSTTGVRDGDLCHLITEGYVLVKTPKVNTDFVTDIAAGDALVSTTDSAANGTTSNVTNAAGRIRAIPATFSATEATDGTAARYNRNIYATAVSACTTNYTNSNLLVHVKVFRD